MNSQTKATKAKPAPERKAHPSPEGVASSASRRAGAPVLSQAAFAGNILGEAAAAVAPKRKGNRHRPGYHAEYQSKRRAAKKDKP